jgi:hypothetical protein
MTSTRPTLIYFALAFGLWPAQAFAQAEAAEVPTAVPGGSAAPREPNAAEVPTSPSAEPKDVVRLKNGGLVRGSIVELLPGQSVTITTVTGKVREFPMSEVSYAGPADAEESKAAAKTEQPQSFAPRAAGQNSNEKLRPHVTVHAEEARLVLESEPSGIVFYRQGGSAVAGNVTAQGYERLCAAPCEISLPAGVESLALSVDRSKPVEAAPLDIPAGRHRVVGRYADRTAIRVVGWVSLIAAPIVGTAIFVQKRERERCIEGFTEPICTKEVSYPYLGTALTVMGVGLLGGLLIFVPDSAEVELSSKGRAPIARRSPGVRYMTAF